MKRINNLLIMVSMILAGCFTGCDCPVKDGDDDSSGSSGSSSSGTDASTGATTAGATTASSSS